MKSRIPFPISRSRALVLGLAAAGITLFATRPADAQTLTSVTFDSATDVASFNQRQTGTNSTTVTDPYIYGAGQGTNGSGALVFNSNTFNTNNDTSALYNVSSSDFSTLGTPITLSLDFHTPATLDTTTATSTPVAGVGFSVNSGNGFGTTTANAFLIGLLRRTAANTYTIQTQTDGSTTVNTAVTGSAAATLNGLTASNWYRLALSLTKTGTASNFTVSVSLFNLGASGTDTPTLVTDATTGINGSTVANAALYNSTNAFAGFRAVAGTNNDAFDNFAVVPEPGSSAAVIGAIGVLALMRRVRRVKA